NTRESMSLPDFKRAFPYGEAFFLPFFLVYKPDLFFSKKNQFYLFEILSSGSTESSHFIA
ncbi:MAG: hypothetical protein ACI81S_001324, partial [Sphingobacteriales bacterium]